MDNLTKTSQQGNDLQSRHLTNAELDQMAWNPKQLESKQDSVEKPQMPHIGDWIQAEALPILTQSNEIITPLSNDHLGMMSWNPIELSQYKPRPTQVKKEENPNRWLDTAYLERSDWNNFETGAHKINTASHPLDQRRIAQYKLEKQVHQK